MGGIEDLLVDIVLAQATECTGPVEAIDIIVAPAFPGHGVGQVVGAQSAADHRTGGKASTRILAFVFLHPNFGGILRGIDIGKGEARRSGARTGQNR